MDMAYIIAFVLVVGIIVWVVLSNGSSGGTGRGGVDWDD